MPRKPAQGATARRQPSPEETLAYDWMDAGHDAVQQMCDRFAASAARDEQALANLPFELHPNANVTVACHGDLRAPAA